MTWLWCIFVHHLLLHRWRTVGYLNPRSELAYCPSCKRFR